MAKKTVVVFVDDLDGGPADRTVQFGLHGKNYEIDLSDLHIKALEESFQDWIAAARPVSLPGPRARAARSTAPGRSAEKRAEDQAIRQWAREQGRQVSDRGRIPQQIRDEYAAR